MARGPWPRARAASTRSMSGMIAGITAMPMRRCRLLAHEVGEPPVVGAAAGHRVGRVALRPGRQPGAERRRRHPAGAEHVGVGEQHLGARRPRSSRICVAGGGVVAGGQPAVAAGLLLPLLLRTASSVVGLHRGPEARPSSPGARRSGRGSPGRGSRGRPRPAGRHGRRPRPRCSDPWVTSRVVAWSALSGVELLAPATVLEDELLGLRDHRRVSVDLVLPDRDVLGDAGAERLGRLLGRRPRRASAAR